MRGKNSANHPSMRDCCVFLKHFIMKYGARTWLLFQFQWLIRCVDGYSFADDHVTCPIQRCFVIVGCLPPVLVELLLPLPDLLASRGAVCLEIMLHDRDRLGGNLDSFEAVHALRVLHLEDESWQTSELPWASLYGNIGGEPSHEVTTTPVACCLLALMS